MICHADKDPNTLPAGFFVHTGNRTERLAAALCEELETPPLHPLSPEIILVQSRGMERWLSLRIADHLGIAGNLRFPFPNTFVEELAADVLPAPESATLFERRLLTWRILKILPEYLDPNHAEAAAFADIRHYARGGAGAKKLWQLAGRTADLFDQYQVFRPQWIMDWESDARSDGWQSILWKRLSREADGDHRTARGRKLIKRLETIVPDDPSFSRLPERISVFGISTLPAFFLDLFHALARHAGVHLYLLNPRADFWGDLPSRRERRRLIRSADARGIPEKDLHLGRENPLLTSLGMVGRDFFDMLLEYDPRETALFAPPDESTLLGRIQSDIFHRRRVSGHSAPGLPDETAAPAPRSGPVPTDPADRSLRIVSCHGPMREAEVLHDFLLSLFDERPDLNPGDVLVMTPDIESFAPYLQAVFDRDGRIPHTITDRSADIRPPLADALLRLLELSGGRFGRAEVTDLLELPALAAAFDLGEEELSTVRRWITDTRIRWGMDAGDRLRMGLPPESAHTWRAGLDRLLLGFAFPAGEVLFQETAPLDAAEGMEAELIGRFADAVDRLHRCAAAVSTPRSLSAWADLLEEMADDLSCPAGPDDAGREALAGALARLRDWEDRSGFAAPLDADIIHAVLSPLLSEDAVNAGFITGRLTCCAMLPMRSIPFPVICLLGMDGNAYPRRHAVPGFDLMAARPRRGDRSRRNDDRYLFLETLLSARDRLYISYTGQNIHDNSPIPPSVVVSELMDYIDRTAAPPDEGQTDGRNARVRPSEQIFVRHRLQGFHPAYFLPGGSLKSFRGDYFAAARLLHERQAGRMPDPPPPFVSSSPPASGHGNPETGDTTDTAGPRTIFLEDMERFLRHPARFFLEQGPGIRFEKPDGPPGDREPFSLDPLDTWRLGDALVRSLLASDFTEERAEAIQSFRFRYHRAAGDLPHGGAARCEWDILCGGAGELVGTVLREPGDFPPPVSADISLSLDGFHLQGTVSGIRNNRLVRCRFATIKGKDLISAWLGHLALCAAARPDYAGALVAGKISARPGIKKLPPVPVNEAKSYLTTLAALFEQGPRRPVPLFPETCLAYAEARFLKEKPASEALPAARSVWDGGWKKDGESAEVHNFRCFGESDPLGDEFLALCEAVYRPLCQCLTAGEAS